MRRPSSFLWEGQAEGCGHEATRGRSRRKGRKQAARHGGVWVGVLPQQDEMESEGIALVCMDGSPMMVELKVMDCRKAGRERAGLPEDRTGTMKMDGTLNQAGKRPSAHAAGDMSAIPRKTRKAPKARVRLRGRRQVSRRRLNAAAGKRNERRVRAAAAP